jgi:hypothetical protein
MADRKPRGFAKGTTVPVAKSKAEIEALLLKHGATQYNAGWDAKRGLSRVVFQLHDRMFRFDVRLPNVEDFRVTKGRVKRSAADAKSAAEREHMRLWRVRYLIVKAKLELISERESTVEAEFLSDMMLPDGTTVRETIIPQIDRSYESGLMPELDMLALPAKGG